MGDWFGYGMVGGLRQCRRVWRAILKRWILKDQVRVLPGVISAMDANSLVLPPALLAQIEAAAAEEHRSAMDVLHDAVARYMTARRRDRSVFRAEELSDADLQAIIEGGMDDRHAHLNAELE